MVGKASLWARWRAPLPKADELRTLGLQRFEIWTSFLEPDMRHSRHVAHLAVQLFDGLSDGIKPDDREACRSILQAAALMHNAGRSRMNKGHHKESARLIRKLSPPLGWTAGEVSMASLIARYHRGAMPSESHKIFSALPKSKRSMVQVLGGILRFACACDRQHDAQIRRVDVESSDPVLRVRADGYGADTSLAEHLAAARYLLEVAYHRPVFVMAS
jgi:exopolyphosphatase/guanosine-5'-triphosphate,3'-diphosphate pyrophosphatase